MIHPKTRVMGTVLRSTSCPEVQRKYADGIFDHLNLVQAVSELEKMAKNVARLLDSSAEVSRDVKELNERKEAVIFNVISAMVARARIGAAPSEAAPCNGYSSD